MRILVIDGQGGGMGALLVKGIRVRYPSAELMAVGTNSAAAAAMHKAGATATATGENAVAVNCRKADIIVGPMAIVMADALMGEISPAMAAAVAQADAVRILIPFNHCNTVIAGVPELSAAALVKMALQELENAMK